MTGYAYSDGSGTSNESHRPPQNSRKPQKKLSGARLARKREIDRQAQRSARVKTKNLIAHLESRIEELTSVHDSGNVKGLIDQLEEQRKANEELRATLQTIGKLVGAKTGELVSVERFEAKTRAESVVNLADMGQYQSEQGDSENGEIDVVEQVEVPDCNLAAAAPEHDEVSTFQTLYNVFADLCSGVPMDQVMGAPLVPSKVCNVTPNINMAHPLTSGTTFHQPRFQPAHRDCQCCGSIRFTDEILQRCSKMQLRNTNSGTQKSRDADIAIRAVLHGWEAVTQKYLLDPVWAVLRLVDQAVFINCARVERLAILRLMILMLRYRANRTEQNLEALPFFLRELPSQRFIPHTPLIDFLVWPTLRERFVLYPHHFCSEKFFSMFWTSYRFSWSHDFRDAYIPNYQTGLYSLSTPFAEQTFDLQHWGMTSEFLHEFAELKDDIPAITSGQPEVAEPVDIFGFEEIAGDTGFGREPDVNLELPANFFGESFDQAIHQNVTAGMISI